MANCILAFPNRVDATYYTVSFSGGSWETDLPLSNLADDLLSKVARSTDATLASTQFVVDLGVPRDIRVVAIPDHNISRAGRVKITAASDSLFNSIVATVDFRDVWQVIYPWGSLPWEHPSFLDGKVSAEDAEDYPQPVVHVFGTSATARYWKIEIDDTTNADGYVQLSRLFLAPGWQPTINPDYGLTLGWEDESTGEASLGGAIFYDEREKRRVAQFEFGYIPEDEALTWSFEMQRLLGTTKQLFYIYNPDDTTHLHRRAFLATMRQLTPLEYPPIHGYNSVGYRIAEVVA